MTTTMPEYALVDHMAEPTAVVRARVPVVALPAFFARSLPRVLAALETQHLVPNGEPFAYYHGSPNGTVDVEAGFPVRGAFVPAGDVVRSELPQGRVVTGVHQGPYEKLAETYAQMSDWAAQRGLTLAAGMWEIYLTDPDREPNPERWLTRVFLEVQ
jgi:effector-binding domain-containing protein